MEDIARAPEFMNLERPDSPTGRGGRLGILTLIYLIGIFFLAGGRDFSISLAGTFDKSTDIIENAVSAGDPIRQVVFISFGLLGLVGCTLKAQASFRPSGWVSRCAIAFGLWSIMSIAWSDDPALTLRRLSVLAMMVLGTICVARRYTIDQIPRFVIFATATYLMIGTVTELMLGTFKPFLSVYRFSGAMHPNEQGLNCAMLLLSIVALAESERRWSILRLAGAGVAFSFLVLTKSRTSLVAAVAALIIFWCLESRKNWRMVIAIFLVAICATLALSVFVSPKEGLYSLMLMGRERSSAGALTGRDLIWNDLLPYFLKRPVGYGYDTFWTPARIGAMADRLGNGVPEGHSTYLDVLLDLGPIGLLLYCGCLGFGFSRSISRLRVNRTSGSMLCVMIFTFFIVHELAESNLIYPSLPQFVFLWCLFAVGWKRVKKMPLQLLR